MADRKTSKPQFIGGLIVLLCGILMVVRQHSDWAMFGEKLQLGAAVVILTFGTVLIATSHRLKDVD